MMTRSDIQKALFENIRSNLPLHISLVDEVADILNVSSDSAYRRIRGEKQISLQEAEQLALHFKLSLDTILGLNSQSLAFKSFQLDEDKFNFHKYLESVYSSLLKIKEDQNTELIFQLNELNLFHAMQFPEILRFKMFYWSKSNLDFYGFRNRKFSLQETDDKMTSLCSRITELYIKINSVEILTLEYLSSFLRQVEYYSDSGFFYFPGDAITLCDKALEMTEHLRKQAESGFKFGIGRNTESRGGNLKLYCNKLALVDNTILVNGSKQGLTYLTNGSVNLIMSDNQDFFRRNYRMVQTILNRSTQISGNYEKERNLFFTKIRENVFNLMEDLPRDKAM